MSSTTFIKGEHEIFLLQHILLSCPYYHVNFVRQQYIKLIQDLDSKVIATQDL
jgi:hypothetical protein